MPQHYDVSFFAAAKVKTPLPPLHVRNFSQALEFLTCRVGLGPLYVVLISAHSVEINTT